MSKQRCLLIFLLLLAAFGLAAQNAFTWKTGVAMLNSDPGKGFTGTSRLDWNQRVGRNIELYLDSNLNATDRGLAPNVQKLWHNGDLGMKFTDGDLRLKAEYRNLAFGASTLLGLYPQWNPTLSQKRLTQHQGTLKAAYALPFLQMEAYAQGKHLRYTPYVFNPNTFELEKQATDGVTDVYTGLSVQAPVFKGVTVHAGADYKDGLFDESGNYRLTDLNAGLAAEYKILPDASLSGSFDWTYRDGDAIGKGRRNHLQSVMRYQHRLTYSISGYLIYVNNSVLSGNFGQLRLVSNYLRGQLQFCFPLDPSGASYILAGGKYSPENKADAYFAETDYRVWKNLYTGGALNWQPDRQTLYTGKLSYYYTPVNELHISYTHLDNELKGYGADYIGLGSSIRW